MDIKEIENLANLSRLDLSDTEKESLRVDLDSILSYVDQIQNAPVDTDRKDRQTSDYDLINVMRIDTNPTASNTHRADLLADAPSTEANYLKVKKVLGGES